MSNKQIKEAIVQEMRVQELFNDLDLELDTRAFLQLDRANPGITGAIAELVKAGQAPEDVAGHVLAKYPHMWVEAQTIRAAARHLEREA